MIFFFFLFACFVYLVLMLSIFLSDNLEVAFLKTLTKENILQFYTVSFFESGHEVASCSSSGARPESTERRLISRVQPPCNSTER